MTTARTLMLLSIVGAGCFQHHVQVAPVHVEPIHMTVDVNVKVDGEVDAIVEDQQPEDRVSDDDWQAWPE